MMKLSLKPPEPEKEKLTAMAKQVMENVSPLKVPLKVNFGAGANWAAAEH